MDAKRIPRLLPDGSVAGDVTVNPKRLERVAREVSEKAKVDAEASEPWGRAKIERERARLAAQPSLVVNGREVKSSLNLNGADLSGQDLSGLDLSGANLNGARLVGTKLTGCRLVGANMHGADLSGASFDEVNAVEANLHGACLCGAKVSKTHLMNANLSECCHEAAQGLDVTEKSLTAAEEKVAYRRKSEGFMAHIATDEGLVRYYGATLEGANVADMKTTCRRQGKKF